MDIWWQLQCLSLHFLYILANILLWGLLKTSNESLEAFLTLTHL